MREVLKNTNLLFWDFVSGDWFQSVLFYFVYTIVEKTYIVLVTKCWKCYIFLFKVFKSFYLLEWTIRIFIKCIVKSNYRFYQGWGGVERLPEYILLTWILIASFLSFSTFFNTQMYHLVFITRITKLKSFSLDLKTKLYVSIIFKWALLQFNFDTWLF